MITNIYVDGSGGAKSGYGFFVKETGESFFEEKPGIKDISKVENFVKQLRE